MFRKLVKTDALAIDDQTFSVRYFEVRTQRGTRRYSAEILLGPDDRIILDDDSVIGPQQDLGAVPPHAALRPHFEVPHGKRLVFDGQRIRLHEFPKHASSLQDDGRPGLPL